MPKRSATEAERALWRTAMRDVRRYRAENVPPAPTVEGPAQPVEIVNPVATARRSTPGGLDRATEERLRRGRIAIDGRIDLHGMTQSEAFGALLGFVESSARAGRRALLVITGKGAVGQGGGVLRRSLPGWLASSPLARRILTVTPAHARHGGDGAYYVLLRRERRSTG
ncbi:MAG TPA: Smr/MutS family protein [Alphaproteobacteria bacterium]|nr:Smr/MutS family protein [Alphaproteobacteria bacterium]